MVEYVILYRRIPLHYYNEDDALKHVVDIDYTPKLNRRMTKSTMIMPIYPCYSFENMVC